MILDFSQAAVVRSLKDRCNAYCAMLQQAERSPDQTFQEWLQEQDGTAATALVQWSWLCSVMEQSETNRMAGLTELLALAMAMDYYTDGQQEAFSDRILKRMTAQLARTHSQICVLQHAEVLLRSANDVRRKDTLDALWRLLQANAGTTGVLVSCAPAKNIFNSVCTGCRAALQPAKPLLLKANQTSYARILLDTCAEMQQYLADKSSVMPAEKRMCPAQEIPQEMVTGIPALNKHSPYASAAVIWQALSCSPDQASLLRGYQVLRHGVRAFHASLPAQMAQFGRPLFQDTQQADSADAPEPFFHYAVYDASSPALYVIQQSPVWRGRRQFSSAFIAAPDNGAQFSLYIGLFFALYGQFSALPARLKKSCSLPEQTQAMLQLEASFASLQAEFPAQAQAAGLAGVVLSDFIDFLEEFVGTADGRNLLLGLLADDQMNICFENLTFEKLCQKKESAEPDALDAFSVWEWFCRYHKACDGFPAPWKSYRKAALRLRNEQNNR